MPISWYKDQQKTEPTTQAPMMDAQNAATTQAQDLKPSSMPSISNAKNTSPAGFAESHPWLNKGIDAASGVSEKYFLQPLAKAASFALGSTARLAAKPMVSLAAGITGDFSPKNIPMAGEVTPFESPENPASTYIAEGEKLAPEVAKSVKEKGSSMLKEAAIDTAGAYLEQGAPGMGTVLKKGFGAVEKIPGASKLIEPVAEGVAKAGKIVKDKAADTLGWISQKSYAQALKPLMSKEIAQNVSKKVSEAMPVGTKAQIKKQATTVMDDYGKFIEAEMKTPVGDLPINVDEVVSASDEAMGKLSTSLSNTGVARGEARDKIRQRLLERADANGTMSLREMNETARQFGNDIKPLFKKNPTDLSVAEQADLDLYYGMRDAVAAKSPKIAAEKAKYHLAKIMHDAVTRSEALELRQNWTGLIGNVQAAQQFAKGDITKGMLTLLADKLTASTLSRTMTGRTAKGLQQAIQQSTGIAPAMAAWVAPKLLNFLQTEERGTMGRPEAPTENAPMPNPLDEYEGFGSEQPSGNLNDYEGF